MEAERLKELLPWRHPFVGIDQVLEVVPNRRIVATKGIAGDDFLAEAHRPDAAAFPGVMLLEGMSQCAAVLFQVTYGELGPGRFPLLGYLKASFQGPAAFGEEVSYEVRALKMTSTAGVFEGTAWAGGRALAEAELAFSVPAPGGSPAPGGGA